mgnify:CR=1 FL=1
MNSECSRQPNLLSAAQPKPTTSDLSRPNLAPVDQQQTSSRLTLSLQRTFNQQSLSCVAENPRIAHSSAALHQTIKLDVHCKWLNSRPNLYLCLQPRPHLAGAANLEIDEAGRV